jgi:hypothetical protein
MESGFWRRRILSCIWWIFQQGARELHVPVESLNKMLSRNCMHRRWCNIGWRNWVGHLRVRRWGAGFKRACGMVWVANDGKRRTDRIASSSE